AVTVSGDNNWSNGYVEIALSGGNTYDQLRLNSSGSLSVSGTAVMWNGNRIGTIDFLKNGQNGAPLRIDFSGSLPNASFETGDLTGWTVDTSGNQMMGQSWAEGPKTSGSVDSDPRYDDEVAGNSHTAQVLAEAKRDGNYGLKLSISGQVDTNCGTGHGPSVTSATFSASAGDTLSMW